MTMTLPVIPGRECGPCSACCTLMAIPELVNQTGKGNHAKCANDHKAPTGSCSIYEDRPNTCRAFACQWLERPNIVPGDVRRRPDNLGLMFTVISIDQTGENVVAAWEVWPGAVLQEQYFLDKMLKNLQEGKIHDDRGPLAPKLIVVTTPPHRVAMFYPERMLLHFPFKTTGFCTGPAARCSVCNVEAGGPIPKIGWKTEDGYSIEWPKCSHGKYLVCDECSASPENHGRGCPECGCKDFFT